MRKLPLMILLAGLHAAPLYAGEAGYFDMKAAPDSLAVDYVDGEGLEKLAGVKRVVVPQFRIEFQTRAESTGSNNSAYVNLGGVDDALMQKLTDQAYAGFVKEMAEKGVEVIGPDSLAEMPEYEPILRVGKASGETLETRDSISRFFAPSGARVYQLLRRTDKDRQGFGSGFATSFADMQKEIPRAELALAQKFGAPNLKVLLTVSPARVKAGAKAGGGLIGAAVLMLSSAEVKPGLAVTEESRMVFRSAGHSENDFKMFGGSRFFGSKVRDFTEEGDSALFLKQDVRVADAISHKDMQDTTSGYNKVSNALAPVMALGLGVNGGKHSEYTIEADPGLFEQVAGAEILAANRMLIGRFKQAADAVSAEPLKSQASVSSESSSLF